MPIYLKHNPRARRNMATHWGGASWDTWEEVPEVVKQKILSGASEPAPSKYSGITSTRQAQASEGYTKFKPGVNNYRRLALAMGAYKGLKLVCPHIDTFDSKKTESAVRSLGINVINVTVAVALLKDAGIIKGNSYRRGAEAAEQAREIVMSIPGVSCPVKGNPYRGRRRW